LKKNPIEFHRSLKTLFSKEDAKSLLRPVLSKESLEMVNIMLKKEVSEDALHFVSFATKAANIALQNMKKEEKDSPKTEIITSKIKVVPFNNNRGNIER
jgi:hypothetical protein